MELKASAYEVRDRVGLITLNRPQVMNAIDDIGQKTGRSARAVICPITRKPMRARATK